MKDEVQETGEYRINCERGRLGSMQFGGKMNMGNLGQEDTTRMVKVALDRGINFIDTADVYSLGESETLVGNALKDVRTRSSSPPKCGSP
jgi:aryl-alcohol dehydrogenase-like predicted oxidoreductase